MEPFIPADISRLIDGDEKAFKSLFDSSYVGLVQRAVYYTNDIAVAEDLVQEVFMHLWEKREELKGIQNVHGYLLFSIRNKCLNHIEHQQVIDKYKQYYLLQEVVDEEEYSEPFIEEVGRLLDKLPEKRRKVLEMSVLESKSYAEIAESLGISLNTVKDHVKKAYAFLREEVRKEVSNLVLFCAFYYREKYS